MKQSVFFTVAVCLMAFSLLFIACENDPTTDPGDGGLAAPGIAIHRNDSTGGDFVFRIHQAVPGATGYEARKGNQVVGAGPNTGDRKVIVPGSELGATTTTLLTARATSANPTFGPDSGEFPAGVKYNSANPLVDEYTDWFNFLDTALEVLSYAELAKFNPYITTYNAIRNRLNNLGPWDSDEKAAVAFNSEGGGAITPASLNAATAAVLANYEDIMDYLLDYEDAEAAAPYIQRLLGTFPRLWFNEVTDPTNDAALGELIKEVWPAVKEVS